MATKSQFNARGAAAKLTQRIHDEDSDATPEQVRARLRNAVATVEAKRAAAAMRKAKH